MKAHVVEYTKCFSSVQSSSLFRANYETCQREMIDVKLGSVILCLNRTNIESSKARPNVNVIVSVVNVTFNRDTYLKKGGVKINLFSMFYSQTLEKKSL